MSFRKFISVILGSMIFLAFFQDDNTTLNMQKAVDSFTAYMDTLDPQKIYLHIDKETYFAGEKIWIKAYLLDGITHVPYGNGDQVYVELVNPYRKISQIKRLRVINGMGEGSFDLQDTIPEGIYQLRSYTNWMRNFGPEFYFHRNIRIMNSDRIYQITEKEVHKNKRELHKLKKEEKAYWFGLFPESGNILAGFDNKIAFKAEDQSGKGVHVTGEVHDQRKKAVISFSSVHNGMGSFMLNPQPGESYTVFVKFPDGSEKKYELPEAKQNTIGFSVTTDPERINLWLRSNKGPSNDRPANEIIILGHVRGRIYYIKSVNLLDDINSVSIKKDIFPSGIVQFTLINNRQIALAQRLVFINHNDILGFSIKRQVKYDSILVSIDPQFNLDETEVFNASVSIVMPEDPFSSATRNTMFSELLLTSDLSGYIEDPLYYFNTSNDSVEKHTDLLMLTHGWTRFRWEDVLSRIPPNIRFEKEKGVTLMGKITREILEIPLKNASVRLFIRNEFNDEYYTTTNEKGIFYFDELYYPDTIDVKLLARKENGGKGLVIHLEDFIPDIIKDYYGDYFLTTHSEIDMKAYRLEQSEKARAELKKRQEELDSIFSNTIYGRPDYVVWGKDLPPGQSDLLQALQGRVPGMSISGNDVTIRGKNSIMLSSEPLLIIDGIPADFSAIHSIPVQDVDRVDILKGPSTAMYGSRGANGVIAIYTKRGTFLIKGELYFSMMGYQTVEKFHAPSTLMQQERKVNGQLPLTLYWNGNLTFRKGEVKEIRLPKVQEDTGYYVLMEGISNQGKPGFSQVTF